MNAKWPIISTEFEHGFSYRGGTIIPHIEGTIGLISEQKLRITRDIINLVSETGWTSYDDVEVEIEQIRDEFNLNDCTDRYDAAHFKFEEIYSINALAIKTYFEAKKYLI